ncbi:hypothetical protein L596_025256 [Steinernema carpocapsae]|uniref:Uncharacterized protein n=1 Tax=Steinernema carpocapsae TaxID=34508 RepID=A0A4U5M789_STECR|nr:hypothetical protein L596_025256 [Steinernema carpocapsae]
MVPDNMVADIMVADIMVPDNMAPGHYVIRAIRGEEIAAVVSVRNKLLDPTAPLIGRTQNSKYVKNDARIKALVELFPSNEPNANAQD